MSSILDNRDMSGFPVSIGTGLALETLFNPKQDVIDEGREFEKIRDINYYDVYIINVETLLRNMLSSIDKDSLKDLTARDVLACLQDEIKMLRLLFDEHHLKLEFCVCSYEYFHRHHEKDMRIPSTEKQITEHKLIEFAKKEIGKDTSVKKFDNIISYGKGLKALIITHIPADLLSYSKFRLLDLLESHTGKIKTRKDYNSKYFPIPREDMTILPFFEYLLLTFGDKVMFKPKPIKDRLDVFEQLKRLKVNPLSTELGLLT